MFMASIGGYDTVQAFSADAEKAKKEAVKLKKKYCKDDLTKWTWAACEEYYGAFVIEIKEGTKLYGQI